ncbi:ester cyclase [Microbispora sp. ATCC PTA-5024]|uniref:ester cyclase n=1 Tax=Microbispora sp. ATCC PTA-5024 TaxID=316330 RepID=UPI0003DC1159|nr:nuclear transport factor 2 family protein [Microbispora sp. ATCC PTA-5024]ETK34029.1 hypothetical protein MPTA5024_21325 [Microbispora sp. ATCC PTA-5024]
MPDVVDRLVDAMNAHDLDAVMRCYRPDAVLVGPEMESADPEEIASYFLQMWQGFPDLHVTLWEKLADGDSVAVELLATGTNTGPYLVVGGDVLEATGRIVHTRCSWFFTVADGLVASHRAYYDQLQIYAQLGLRLPLSFDPS